MTYVYLLSPDLLLVNIWNKGTVLVDTKTGLVRQQLALGRAGQLSAVTPSTGNTVWVANKQGNRWLIDRRTGQLSPAGQLAQTSYSFTALLETTDGTLWSGTFGNGLIEWSRQRDQVQYHYGNRESGGLYDNHVTCLFEDRR